MRPKRSCRICKDTKAIAWVQALLEEGYRPRRITRAKAAGHGFSRRQVVRHVNECPNPNECQDASLRKQCSKLLRR